MELRGEVRLFGLRKRFDNGRNVGIETGSDGEEADGDDETIPTDFEHPLAIC